MIVKEFRQKKGSKYRNFVLYTDRINIEVKTANEFAKYDVKIESLGMDLHYHAANKSKLPIALFCGLMLTAITSILVMDEKYENTMMAVFMGLMLIIVSVTLYYKNITDDIYLVGGSKNILFFRNIPDEQSVLEFIKVITVTQKEFFRAKYIAYTNRTSVEEYEARLNWLKDINAINDDEYGELLYNFEINKIIE